MDTAFHSFLRRLSLFSLLIGLVGWGIMYFLPAEAKSPVYAFIIIFFYSFTLLQHRYLLKAKAEKLSKFANRFMLFTFLKLFIYLIIIVLYALVIHPEDAIPFMVTFLLAYLGFTSFEVIEIFQATKKE